MYIPTIGLEIHVELKTATKMFCACRNDPDEKCPNVNVCPVCLGHPGTLPTINREAVAAVIKAGLALGGTVAERSHFDRKSYFYPDLPKGYQISQYEAPLITGGFLNGVRITRIHLEEDTGRLLHELPGGAPADASFVDFNRAGLPLMELVTEPDIKNAGEAVAFARELQLILRYLGISDGDMEKGHVRVEANISMHREGEEYGTKVEIKNLNSFRTMKDAIDFELKRQERILEKGEKVMQETYGTAVVKKLNFSSNVAFVDKSIVGTQRSKESSHDYRYFPEPDLPPLDLKEWNIEKLRQEVPELPEAKRKRFAAEFGFAPERAELITADMAMADYFEEAASELKALAPEANLQYLYNYLTSDLKGLMNEKGIAVETLKVSPEHLAHLVSFIAEGKLSSRLAKDLLAKMFGTGEDPETLMAAGELRVVGDEGELTAVAREIIEKNPRAVEDYRKGKGNALQFLIGQAIAHTKGQADPEKLRELFKKEIK